MFHRLIPIVLLALGDPPSAPPPADLSSEESFRTDAAPRIDPVFGDVAELRASIDKFLSLQGEMDHVRDEFSSAVHETLAALADETPGPHAATDARQCPAATGVPYARALASGARYLALGQQVQASYREIRRAEDLGDTLGLTPDYRLRAKKAKDMHQQLLSDYREMRVAFYDQLGAELRHAGCKLTAKGIASSPLPGANLSSSLEPTEGSRPAIKSIGPSSSDFDALLSDLAEPANDLTPPAGTGHRPRRRRRPRRGWRRRARRSAPRPSRPAARRRSGSRSTTRSATSRRGWRSTARR